MLSFFSAVTWLKLFHLLVPFTGSFFISGSLKACVWLRKALAEFPREIPLTSSVFWLALDYLVIPSCVIGCTRSWIIDSTVKHWLTFERLDSGHLYSLKSSTFLNLYIFSSKKVSMATWAFTAWIKRNGMKALIIVLTSTRCLTQPDTTHEMRIPLSNRVSLAQTTVDCTRLNNFVHRLGGLLPLFEFLLIRPFLCPQNLLGFQWSVRLTFIGSFNRFSWHRKPGHTQAVARKIFLFESRPNRPHTPKCP